MPIPFIPSMVCAADVDVAPAAAAVGEATGEVGRTIGEAVAGTGEKAMLDVSARAIELTRKIDFRVPHELSSKFDAWYSELFGSLHPYSSSFPLMTPHAVMAIILGYLMIVFVGVQIVKRTGGVKCKPIMRLYNLFMVVLSGYMGTKSILLARASNNTVFCVPLAHGSAGGEMARLTWMFTFSKVLEFLDTVFMIVEGRLRQVSFLHVYHHFTILSYWFTITWMAPGSDAYFSLAGNSYIHVAMYGYYLLASFGYSPWWKYYITKAQITQFCLFCVQSVYVGYIMTETRCDFPNVLSRGLLWYMLTLIALFGHFLVTNAGKKKKTVQPAKKTE